MVFEMDAHFVRIRSCSQNKRKHRQNQKHIIIAAVVVMKNHAKDRASFHVFNDIQVEKNTHT